MFDNLLQLAADEDKVTLKAMADKYPSLKQHFELGETLAELRPTLKELHASYENDPKAAIKELRDWRKFKSEDWPKWQEQNTQLESTLRAAQEKIAEFEARTETDMTAEEVKQVVQNTLAEAGYAKSADLENAFIKVINEKVGPTLDEKITGLTVRFEDVFDKIEDVIQTHQSEFKEKLRPKQVFDYMKEHKLTDPESAYKQMTADKYAAKSQAQIDADKKAEYDKGLKEGEAKALKARGAERSPVDGNRQGAAKPGALMRRAMAKMPKEEGSDKIDSSKIPLGKGIARAATEEYYNKQAGAVQ